MLYTKVFVNNYLQKYMQNAVKNTDLIFKFPEAFNYEHLFLI